MKKPFLSCLARFMFHPSVARQCISLCSVLLAGIPSAQCFSTSINEHQSLSYSLSLSLSLLTKPSSAMMNQELLKKKKIWSVPVLPTHIIFDILSRLPIETLSDCRLVCRDWLSLISDPHFTNLSRLPICLLLKPRYRNRSSTQLRLIDLQNLHTGRPLQTLFKFNSQINFPTFGKVLLNSCNGLICLADTTGPIFICNPILRKYIDLHFPPYEDTSGILDGFALAEYGISALGFSPKTNQYKVIHFYRKAVDINSDGLPTSYEEETQSMIYTLGEGPWRNLGKLPYHLTNHSFNAFVNGALHWLNFTSPELIRSFDFVNERLRVIPEPPEFDLHGKEVLNNLTVGVLRECLAICDFSRPSRVDLWVMKDYGIKESWSKEFVIDKVTIGLRGPVDHCEPLMILKSGEILMLFNKKSLALYNPKLNKFKHLNIYGIKSEFYGIAHIPSLVSLDDIANGQNVKICRAPDERNGLDFLFG